MLRVLFSFSIANLKCEIWNVRHALVTCALIYNRGFATYNFKPQFPEPKNRKNGALN